MSSIVDIKNELDELRTMKFVASAFTEAAATKLKNIRKAFERNHQFYEEISHLYHLVRLNANNIRLDYQKGKNIHIALTSNQHFYGSLNANIMQTFLHESQSVEGDLMVIGTTGIEYLKSVKAKNVQKLIFSDDNPKNEELNTLLSQLSTYERVIIYYAKFVTLLSQSVGTFDITQSQKVDTKEEQEVHIIFEPELEKIVEFFQHQVRLILLLRVLFETDIARTSARLVAMSAAEDRADELIKESRFKYNKALATVINTQLLETFTGLSKWVEK